MIDNIRLEILDDFIIIDTAFRHIKGIIPSIPQAYRQKVDDELELGRSTFQQLLVKGHGNLNEEDKLQAFYLALRQIRIMMIGLFNECQEIVN